MKITFLRHAQSIFNVFLQSEKDCDLSPAGIQQAKNLTGDYDVVVVSNLRRTHQTLLYSSIQSKRILLTPLCREQKKDICDFVQGEDDCIKETEEELALRIECFKDYIRRECKPDERVLVISHGDFIDCATGRQKYPANGEFRDFSF